MKALATLLFAVAFPFTVHAAAKELEGIRAPADTACPSPEESQKLMTVPDGYAVRCWAHEPMVMNPVAMTWDARGRLWVVEAYEYPEGTPLPVEQRPFGGEAKDDHYHPVPAICLPASEISNLKSQIPKDRVIILEDTDNDGVADKRTVFVQGLNLASAIICGDDGIYVGQQPHLIHFKDSNHDDKPDDWRVVLTGFGREDTHELVNSFCWGPDGWLYMTHGVFTNSKVRAPGVPEKDGFKFDAGIGRCRPVASVIRAASPSENKAETGKLPVPQSAPPHWEFEVFADGTSNPWGCDYDERGNFFVSACVIDHFFHMAPGGIYVRQGGAPENPYAYEQLPSIVTHKHFRAAYAGVQIYQGGVYPQDTWGHVFIGNIHDNAIHEEVLTPVGSTFQCEPRRDFLRANNGWFRPVSTRTGPDGNLWVMDWCDKYPCYQNAKANPEGVDRERGRIWRVVNVNREASWSAVASDSATPLSSKPDANSPTSPTAKGDCPRALPKLSASPTPSQEPRNSGVALSLPTALHDASRPTKDMDLSKLDTEALVKLLEHPNNWMRRWARRELVERFDSSDKGTLPALVAAREKVLAKLVEIIVSSKPVAVRVEALRFHFAVDSRALPCWIMFGGFQMPKLKSLNQKVPPGEFDALRLASDREPAIRQALARYIADKFSAYRGQLYPGSVSLIPNLDVLKQLSQDQDPAVLAATAQAWRAYTTGPMTIDRTMSSSWPNDFDVLLQNAASRSDQGIEFAIWMAIEHPLGWVGPETLTEWMRWMQSCEPLSHKLSYKSMRRLCDTRDAKNLDLALDFLSTIKAHDVLLAHALDGLEKGQEGGVIKPTKAFSTLFAEFAKSDNADVRKHAQNLSVLWGDAAAIERLVATMLDAKTVEAERIGAVQTLRKVRNDEARKAYAQVVGRVCDPAGAGPGSQSSAPSKTPTNESPSRESSASGPGSQTPATTAFALEVIRAASDLGDDTFPKAIASGWAHFAPTLRVAALDTLVSRPAWTHAMLDAIASSQISATGFPVSVRRQLATSQDKAIRDHAFKVLGAWKDSSDDVKALIAAKKAACLEGEPDIAAGKLMFQATCMVCHTFHGGGQKVGPELIGSGRSNLDALLANVIDPNQIIGNGYENIVVTTKDNRTLAGRVTEDTPSQVKLLAIGGAETVVSRDQIAKLENTHQSLMPMGFGGLPDEQFRNLIWYVLAPPEEGPLTPAKKKLLSTSIDSAPTKPQRAKDWRSIDWESVSLWNPQWKVKAPEFQGTPSKRDEYHGRKNVLVMHPFEDKKTPASLERQWNVEASKHTLKFGVAADDRGDWELRILVNDKVVKKQSIGHDEPRWKDMSLDLSEYIGKAITVRLEGHPTGWSWEFGYWDNLRLE